MKLRLIFFVLLINALCAKSELPWSHGPLQVSENGAYLQHADGTPFFWLGNTGWLLPQKTNQEQVRYFLDRTAEAEFNVVLVQTLNAVPSSNAFGQESHIDNWDFSNASDPDVYGYWDHMDYIVDEAQQRGIYIGMVCIWGGLVKSGKMDSEQACTYGRFLAERYKDRPNIIWIIGGDIRGDVKPDVWESLARTIKSYDHQHLMTFHPFGRSSSAYWWHQSDWLDFNLFQSGHRRYDQTRGDGDDTSAAAVAEDNWRYVADGIARSPRKPIIDGEPSYEGIPQGLHDTTEPRWRADDVRRYAYWSTFAGAAGHTYGNNSIMQIFRPGDTPAYGAEIPWYEAINDAGFHQMKHLKRLMTKCKYHTMVPDQSLILSENGERYERDIAIRNDNILLVYTFSNRKLTVDLTKISGDQKSAWWFDPKDGTLEYIGQFDGNTATFHHQGAKGPGNDYVLVVTDTDVEL